VRNRVDSDRLSDHRRRWPSSTAGARWERQIECIDHIEKLRRQPPSYRVRNRLGHLSVKSLGNTAGNLRLRVAVAAERYRQTDGMLEVIGIQEGDDRFPSTWFCVTAALRSASRRTSSTLVNARPTGATRIAEPLPQLL